MANRFYRIQIDELFLTDSGLESGTPCKLQISNLEDLLTNVIGQPSVSASGAVVSNLASWTKGKSFEIAVEILTESVWSDLIELINDSLENDTDFEIIGTGSTGNFSVDAKPNPVKPFSSERFLNGRIYGCVFKFITQ